MLKTFKKGMLLSAVLASSIAVTSQSYACTAVTLEGSDGHVVAGRTMEWSFDWPWSVIYLPQGTLNTLTAPKNLELPNFQYKSKYSVLGSGLHIRDDNILLDGQNSEGLALSANYLPNFTEYQTVSTNDKHYASVLETTTYILSQFKTVQEVEDNLKDLKVWSDRSTEVNGVAPDVHFLITDKSGDAIIIEYVKGEVKFYHLNTDIKVMTNAPTYDWHLINLRNYLGLSNETVSNISVEDENDVIPDKSAKVDTIDALGQGNGFLGLPGDFSPPSRFIRAATFSYYVNKEDTSDTTVSKVTHILHNMDIPKGTVSEQAGSVTEYDHTAFTAIKDLSDNTLYMNSYDNPLNSVSINLDTLDKNNSPAFYKEISQLPYPSSDISTTLHATKIKEIDSTTDADNNDKKTDDSELAGLV